jgi:serine/threonine-protein kinase
MLFAHLEQPPPSASAARSDLAEAIDSVIAVALAKSPAGRYETGAQLTTAAREALGLGERTHSRWALPLVLALAGVAAIAVAVAAYLVVTGGRSTALAAVADSGRSDLLS